jgi:hypothetical protein
MVNLLLIIGLLLLPLLNNADNGRIFSLKKIFRKTFYLCIQGNNDTSITATTWFWPVLSICLALIISVPCTLMIVVIFWYKKKDSDDSNESTTSSNSSSSSSSSISVQRRPTHHPRCSHYAGGFRSPPPPYTTTEQPENFFSSSSLPPPYESHVITNGSHSNPTTTTIIDVEPADTTGNQSLIYPEHGTTLDLSSTFTNPSMQTFQA